MTDTEISYDPAARGKFELLDRMYVERGDKSDWELLHHLHYKSDGDIKGARFYRLGLEGETIGVAALTLTRPLIKERHAAFPKLKPRSDDNRFSNTHRYNWVNENIRIIARLVLDTMFRGVGASYRFQNIVSRMSGFRIIEIQSSMSKYNLFAQKAGFTFVRPMRSNKYDVGMRFFKSTFASHPADTAGLIEEIMAIPEPQREKFLEKVRLFYFRNSARERTGTASKLGMSRVNDYEPKELVRHLQQLVLATPLYGFYMNPDFGRDMPERIPLSAFDRQPSDKPLVIEE